MPLLEPWVTVGYSTIPDGFETNPARYTELEFWNDLKATYSTTWPIPIDNFGNLKSVNDLFFNSQLSADDTAKMDQPTGNSETARQSNKRGDVAVNIRSLNFYCQ